MAEGVAKGTFVIKDNEFHGFTATSNGNKQTILTPQTGPDNMNVNIFKRNKFIDCDLSNFVFMSDPPGGWANIADCGNFPCTAPKQALWQFYDNQIINPKQAPPVDLTGDFQIIHDNEGFAPHIDTCQKVEAWNAYVCRTTNFGILSFESNDADKMDRTDRKSVV